MGLEYWHLLAESGIPKKTIFYTYSEKWHMEGVLWSLRPLQTFQRNRLSRFDRSSYGADHSNIGMLYIVLCFDNSTQSSMWTLDIKNTSSFGLWDSTPSIFDDSPGVCSLVRAWETLGKNLGSPSKQEKRQSSYVHQWVIDGLFIFWFPLVQIDNSILTALFASRCEDIVH